MENTYKSYEEFCRDLRKAENGQPLIVNGWDCTFLPPATIDAIKDYDSLEQLVEDIAAKGTYLSMFRMYEFNGIKFELGIGWRWENEQHPAGLHAEGCHTDGQFFLEKIRRA